MFFKEDQILSSHNGNPIYAIQFRAHSSDLEVTLAMATGVTASFWKMCDMVAVLED